MTAYVLQRVINNNVVQVRRKAETTEYIWMGRGLGFGLKPGMELEEEDPRIEKRYTLDPNQPLSTKISFLSGLFVSWIEQEFKLSVSEQVSQGLSSHLQFMMNRLAQHIEISNPFLFEIQTLHEEEYALAKRFGLTLEEAFSVQLPEDEIGFLAMHIQSAVTKLPVDAILKRTRLIQEMVQVIEKEYGQSLKKNGMNYVRLITHFRFCIERMLMRKKTSNPFTNQLKEQFPNEYHLSLKIAKIMETTLDLPVSEDEIGFLVMHLYRLSIVE